MVLTITEVLSGPYGHIRQMSKRFKMSVSMLSRLKNGERSLTLEAAKRIADYADAEVVLIDGQIRFELMHGSWLKPIATQKFNKRRKPNRAS